AVARATPRGVGHGFDDRTRGMPQDQRPPRAEEVEVGAPVHVDDARALGARDEEGRAADGAERAHRPVHAPGNHALGGVEERGRPRHAQAVPAAGPGGGGGVQASATKSRAAASQAKMPASARRPSTTDSTTYAVWGYAGAPSISAFWRSVA